MFVRTAELRLVKVGKSLDRGVLLERLALERARVLRIVNSDDIPYTTDKKPTEMFARGVEDSTDFESPESPTGVALSTAVEGCEVQDRRKPSPEPPIVRRGADEKRIGFMSKIGTWISCLIHIRRIQRTASAAAQAADSAVKEIAPLHGEIETLSGGLASLRGEIDALSGGLASLRGEMSPLGATVASVESEVASLKRQLTSLEGQVTPLQAEAESVRSDFRRLETQLEGVWRDRDKQLVAVRREILFQQRRLTLLAEAQATGASSKEAPKALAGVVDRRLDSLYVALEDALRGSREDIKARLGLYVERMSLAGGGDKARPILDVGCGRGEWLELLRERHLNAYGIDSNVAMIELAMSLGLDARHADLLQHLGALSNGSLSAVTAFHVIEHLPFGVLVDFLDEVLRVLMPGGTLILETPNPETLRVGATTFFNDPTHRKPIPPLLLQFLVQNRGFTDLEILTLHPFTEADRLHDPGRDAAYLNLVLFGPQDYAIIARRG